MIKVNLLEARMKEKNVWYPELIEALGFKSYQSWWKRIKGKVDFRRKDLLKIKSFLNLTNEQLDDIFFNNELTS